MRENGKYIQKKPFADEGALYITEKIGGELQVRP